MPGAFDDVQTVYEPDPKDPTNQLVIIANINHNKTIAANVRVTASTAVQVLGLDRSRRDLFPHEFKVTIEAGARQLVGRRRLDQVTSVSPRVVNEILVTFNVQGAVYVEDEPQPPPSSEIPQYLVFYEIDLPPKIPNDPYDKGQSLIYAINMNHQFRLQAMVESTNTVNEWWTPSLGVFECRLSHSCYDVAVRRGWRIANGKFVPEYPPFA